jgi:hypothetical protein
MGHDPEGVVSLNYYHKLNWNLIRTCLLILFHIISFHYISFHFFFLSLFFLVFSFPDTRRFENAPPIYVNLNAATTVSRLSQMRKFPPLQHK